MAALAVGIGGSQLQRFQGKKRAHFSNAEKTPEPKNVCGKGTSH